MRWAAMASVAMDSPFAVLVAVTSSAIAACALPGSIAAGALPGSIAVCALSGFTVCPAWFSSTAATGTCTHTSIPPSQLLALGPHLARLAPCQRVLPLAPLVLRREQGQRHKTTGQRPASRRVFLRASGIH